MKLTFEHKKTHIDVYGDCINSFVNIMSRSRIGRIRYDARFDEYNFITSFFVG